MEPRFVFNFEAAKAALVYLAAKDLSAFDKYKACKLLFLADREHLLRFGRTITGDSYDALPYGPAPSQILVLLDGLQAEAQERADTGDVQVEELARSIRLTDAPHAEYRAQAAPDLDALSESDIQVLDHVAAEHGNKTFPELYNLTHGLAAFKRAWRDDPVHKKFAMRFEDFFVEAPEKEELLREILENQFLDETCSHPTRACA